MQLKHHFQKKGSSACGPSSLKMVFGYCGKKVSDEKLVKECRIVRGKGTSHKKMIEVSKKYGFRVKARNKGSIKDIIRFIDKKNPVIVNFINPKSGKGHYSVVKDYDIKKRQLIFADPSNGDGFRIDFDKFNKIWFNKKRTSHQWMMVVS